MAESKQENAQERQHRIEAIGAMSQQGEQPTQMVTPMDRPPRNMMQLAIIGLVVLIIVGSVTGYLILSRSKQPTNTQKPAAVYAIDLGANKLYCAQTPVFSPDGHRIAIIASDVRCIEPNNTATPDQYVGVFDVATGKPLQIIPLKDMLAQRQLVGRVNAIAWSPDSKSLAIFGPVLPTATIGVNKSALILYPTTDPGATPRVIIAPPLPNPYQVQVWNLRTLSAGPTLDISLAPALTYRWTADGHIVPDQPFSTHAGTVTGRSAINGSFTFWQSGIVAPASVQDGHYVTGSDTPSAIFFASAPVLWSPDSRYVVSGIGIGGPVAFSTPRVPALTCPGPDLSQAISCPSQAISLPDPALAAVVKATMQGETITFTPPGGDQTTLSSWPAVPVAWNPDGKYLITILPGNEEYQGAKKLTMTVFNTLTGNPVKQFQQDIAPGKAACYGGLLSWSPTGARIALAQCSTDSIILWNADSLSA